MISINEPLDDSPAGHMLEGIIETIDEFYSENLGQDIRRGMKENAERGFFNGSRPPYGFRRLPVQDDSKTRYKLEPESQDSIAVRVVRRIFDLAAKGEGCKEITKTLNDEGIHTSTGQRWGKTTIHKVLTNEAYCGTLVWGGRPGHPAIRSGIPPVRVEDAWPAIINKDIFQFVQKGMSSKAPIEIHPRVVPSFYLLSGLLYCSCGRAMIGRSAKSHQYYYYMCNRSYKQGKGACGARSLPKDKLEHTVIEQIKERILNDEWLEELVTLVNEELDTNHSELKDRLDLIDAELTEINIRLSRDYDALETGKLALDDLAPRIKELRGREEELSKTRVQVEAELVLQGRPYIDADLVRSYAEDLKSLLEESEFAESKAFLRSFIKRIAIDEEKATIYYSLPMPPDRKKKEQIGVLPIVTPGGAEGIRTPDLLRAKEALSRLSYSPTGKNYSNKESSAQFQSNTNKSKDRDGDGN